jgi:hypothetical protein
MLAAINIGTAPVEPLAETYFFEVATRAEAGRFYGIYRSSQPLASFVGR